MICLTFLTAAVFGAYIVCQVFLYVGDSIIAGNISPGDFFAVLTSFGVVTLSRMLVIAAGN